MPVSPRSVATEGLRTGEGIDPLAVASGGFITSQVAATLPAGVVVMTSALDTDVIGQLTRRDVATVPLAAAPAARVRGGTVGASVRVGAVVSRRLRANVTGEVCGGDVEGRVPGN